ncbi:MAG: uroporphyrinogen decarboxylase, partial [Chloroflexia bacterium]|nr:uroporphyrinogen decarboxylase [Chloroflexia bacterium]
MTRLLIRACRREPVERTPIWLMRQAGRYMSVYRAVRERHGFLQMVKQPEVAAEVTLQPIEAFGMDAAIIFADILPPLEGLGLHLTFEKGEGPVIHNPIRVPADIAALRPYEPEAVSGYTLEALRIVRAALPEATALFGFSGAPFTLASYAIEGGGSREYRRTKIMMYRDPASWQTLMTKLTDLVVAYLIAQVQAGADVVQIFDSWAGALSPGDFADLDFLVSSVGLTEDINGHYQLKVKAVTPAGISEYSLENNMQDFEIYPVSISVASMNISNGEKDVKIDEVITLTFSRPIIEGINYSKITFTDNSLNKVEFSKSIEGSTLTLTPLQPLANGTVYKLSLPVGAVEDSFGYVLKNTYEMSFETVSSSPQVIFTDPWDKEHDVFLDSDIRIKYSESINAGPAFSDIYLALVSDN